MAKKRLIIDIDLTSSSGHPEQVQSKLAEIVASFKGTALHENFNEFNHIVYNDWDEPHRCELTITLTEE